MSKRKNIPGYKRGRLLSDGLFLLPALFFFSFVILIPFVLGIYYSFTNWDGINYSKQFIGFANYKSIFTDMQFLYSAYATLKYALLSIVMVNVWWDSVWPCWSPAAPEAKIYTAWVSLFPI